MIWSSLARNRSLSPVVARCLGRIATLRCAANHGWTPRRIAKNEIARFRHLMAPHLAIPNPLPVPKPIPDQLPTSSSRATKWAWRSALQTSGGRRWLHQSGDTVDPCRVVLETIAREGEHDGAVGLTAHARVDLEEQRAQRIAAGQPADLVERCVPGHLARCALCELFDRANNRRAVQARPVAVRAGGGLD